MAARTFIGLDSTAWIAILTGALVFVTGFYAWSTRQLVGEAKRSGEAAERAAASSQKAAEASERAAAVAEARVDVRFEAEYNGRSVEGCPGGVLRLICRGDPLFVHQVSVDFIHKENRTIATALRGQALEPAEPGRQFPVRLFRDEATAFRWPAPVPDRDLKGAGVVVLFSVLRTGDPDERTVRIAFYSNF